MWSFVIPLGAFEFLEQVRSTWNTTVLRSIAWSAEKKIETNIRYKIYQKKKRERRALLHRIHTERYEAHPMWQDFGHNNSGISMPDIYIFDAGVPIKYTKKFKSY